jgi:hypothetical protein
MAHTTFVSRANIHSAQFWFWYYYLLHAIFVSRADIPRAFSLYALHPAKA